MSTPPGTTRVVVARPVCPDASGVTVPTAVPAPTTSGSREGLSPHRSMIGTDHVRAPRSNMPDVEPIEGSVTSVPVRRYTIQSAIMLSLAHASHSTGWHCRTQARRGGALSEIQPPPSR